MNPWRTENLSFEPASERVWVFTISRPRELNAMPMAFLKEAHELLGELEGDTRIRCVVLTGAGDKSFSSGGDLREERAASISDHERLFEYNLLGGRLCLRIWRHRLPFVAAVNGYALGAPVALIGACDLALASEKAVFGLPTPALGGVPGWGCTQIAARRVGPQNLKRMLLANEWLDAREALRIGLVGKVLPPERLMEEAIKTAETIAGHPPKAMSAVKKAVNDGLEAQTLEAWLLIEHELLKATNIRPAFAEGIAALLEKRPPNFPED